MAWVRDPSFDGLGQPKTVTLSGATWSTALMPLALLLLAAAVAALAVRGWPLRALAVLVAVASSRLGYLAISLWVVPDIAVARRRAGPRPGGVAGGKRTALLGRRGHAGRGGVHVGRPPCC